MKEPKIRGNWSQKPVDLLILSRVWTRPLSIHSAFCCWFVDFWNDSMWKNPKFGGTGRKSLLICWFYLGFELGLWVLVARFAVDLLISESMWNNQKFRGTGCKRLLICWFYLGFVLGLWVSIARFAVDLWIFEIVTLDNIWWFVYLSICWAVDMLSCWAVELLSCWTVELLSCWAVELLICWAVELLSCWAVELLIFEMAPCKRTENLGELVAKACWFVDFIFS